jgi:hypothetical protein
MIATVVLGAIIFMNRSVFPLVALILLIIGLGCGFSDRVKKAVVGSDNSNIAANGNKSIADKALDTAVGGEKIGIPECDEAMDILVAQANNPDDNFVTKAIKTTALSQFREQVRKGLDNNNANRADTAKFCREFKTNLEKSLAESNSNK